MSAVAVKRSAGARHSKVAQHLKYKIVKRVHHTPPYEESWHEYLAFEGDRLVGRVTSFEAPLGSRECWINDLWVEQRHRGSGLGGELLKVTLENARARGYQSILAELTPYDSAAMPSVERFYHDHGFEVVHGWEGTAKSVALRAI